MKACANHKCPFHFDVAPGEAAMCSVRFPRGFVESLPVNSHVAHARVHVGYMRLIPYVVGGVLKYFCETCSNAVDMTREIYDARR